MDIAFITNTFPDLETASIGTQRMLKVFREVPCVDHIHFITGNYPNSGLRVDNCTMTLIDKPTGNKWVSYAKVEKLIAEVLSGVIDRISTVVINSPAPHLVLAYAKARGKKILYMPSGSVKLNCGWVSRQLETLNFELSDKIVIYSDRLIPDYGLEKYRSKIVLAYNHFIDTEKFKTVTPHYERLDVVGFIGRLDKEKGILSYLNTVPKIVPFLDSMSVSGTGLFENMVKATARAYKEFDYLGWVSHKDVPSLLNQWKLLVIPSINEGLPNTLLEAMICGTPVLASPVGAIPDLVKHGMTGFIWDNKEPLHKGIIEALNYPKISTVINNAKDVAEGFTLDSLVVKYNNILEGLIE